MGRVVFGIFAAAVFVVVFDEVLEDGRKEVEFLVKDALKTKLHQLIDQGTAKIVALAAVADVVAEFVEKRDFGACSRFDRKNLVVVDGNVAEGVVKEFGKFFLVLAHKEGRQKVFSFEFGTVGVQLHEQHFVVVF